MPTNTFSFEDAVSGFQPAKRKRRGQFEQIEPDTKSSKRGSLPKDQNVFNAIKQAAEEFGVPLEYGLALAEQESGYNANAHNNEFGADGPFQFVPSTAAKHGLKPGVDTRDWVKASRAAMQDFAEQMQQGGVDWAIKHHFAGPNTDGHGPKTRQYLADVQQRAADIKAQLAKQGGAGSTGAVDTPVVQATANAKTFTFEEVAGPSSPAPAIPKKSEEPSLGGFLKDQFAEGHILDVADPAVDALDRGFQKVKNRFMTDLGMISPDDPRYDPVRGAQDPFQFSREETARLQGKKADQERPADPAGFFANVKNPVDLILNDSLPANALEWLNNADENARAKLFEARRVAMQENIVANPDKFPDVAVQAAQQAIAERKAKQKPGVAEMWHQLKQAAKEDPGRFGAQLANSLLADPEMLLAPEGLGLKVIRGTKRAITGTAGASRVLKTVDKAIDAGTAGAALNMGIEAAAAGSEGEEVTAEKMGFAGALGFGLSAPFSLIFAKGARARTTLKKGGLGEGDLQNAMKDLADEDLAVEDLINNPDKFDPTVRDRIEETLGIKNMSETERKRWHARRQKELSKTFADESQEADYLAFKAEERIHRAEQLREDAAAKEAATAAEKQKQEEVDRAFQEDREARTARYQQEYEQALAARETAKNNQMDDLFSREEKLREVTDQLDQEEIMEAALTEDIPAIKRAMNRAARRDSNLRMPKWQRGETDPATIARVGAAGLFAGSAYALADPEDKEKAAFAAGLAGLILPAGGSILSRLRQSGAVAADGSMTGLARLVKEGKLKPERTLEQAKAAEKELVAQAKQGDEQAFAALYKENFPRLARHMRSYARKLGMEPEDLAQETFVKAFKNIDKFDGDSQFYTWLHSIGTNEGLQAIRKAENLREGGKFSFESPDKPDVLTPYGERYGNDLFEEGAGADLEDTPENRVLAQDAQKRLTNLIEALPEKQRRTLLLNRVEGYTAQEIAEMTNQNLSTVLMQIKIAQDKVLEGLEKGFGAQRKVTSTEEVVKRGRGRPRKVQLEAGEIDPRLMKVGAVAALGAGAGAWLNEQNKYAGALSGALIATALAMPGKTGKTLGGQIVKGADYTLGITSTRIMNISKPIWRRAIEHERVVLRDTHKHLTAVDPFVARLRKLPKNSRDILSRAILTGKPGVVDKLLETIGDKDLTTSWKAVRSTLDSLGDQLVHLKRFQKKELEYFPRMVKDVKGLIKALGGERGSYLEQAIKDADTKAIRARGTGLTDLEKSLITNKILSSDANASQQPGYAKNRVIEEITPELQPFYYTPEESLHSYIRASVEDIERAKFFGKDLSVVTKNGKEYTNMDTSVGNMVNRLIAEGKVAPEQAEEIGSMLKSRFINGERAPNEVIQWSKNISYAGLLGNPFSAAVQLGDVVIQAFTQDLRSALSATVRSLTGRKIVSMKEFGLADHMAEEFASTSRSANALKHILGFSLFKGVDYLGKDVALNASILRMGRLAKSDSGIQSLMRKYGDALAPEEMNQLVKDLQKGEATDLVRSIAFAELSRTQPITRLELPQAYLDNPNGRLLYQYKTFMLKQIDLVRRDAYNQIKSGKVASGLRDLTKLGIGLGVAGMTTAKIRDFMLGKDVDIKATDVPVNMLKTFGLSQYFVDQFFGVSKEEAAERRASGDTGARTVQAAPLAAVGNTAVPPYKMFDQIVTADKKALRYIPFIGPYIYENYVKEQKDGNR